MSSSAEHRRERLARDASYREAERARDRERYFRKQYGDYKLKPYCESGRAKCPAKRHDEHSEQQLQFSGLERSYRLMVHHTEFTSCPECMRNGSRPSCKRKDHLMTVCFSCHNSIHQAYDARVKREIAELDKRFERLINESP